MLPPPTTTAGWMPISTTSASWRAIRPVDASEIPEPEAGAKASPESFSRTRGYVGRAPPTSMRVAILPRGRGPQTGGVAVGAPQLTLALLGLLAELEPGEPLDLHLLAGLHANLVEVLLDRLAVVLHERLVEQHVVLEERLDLALHDLGHDVVGLAGLAGLRLGDLLLGLQHGGGHVVAADPARSRRARDVQREVLHQLAELVGVGDEVRLAVDFDEDADGVVEVHVGVDEALVGAAPRTLGGAREALLPKELGRPGDVAVGLDQRALAVHHPRAGRVAELLDHRGGDLGHQDPSPAATGASSRSAVAAGSDGATSATIASPSGSVEGTSGSKTVLAAIAAASSGDGVSSTAAGAACGLAPVARGARAVTFSPHSSLAIPYPSASESATIRVKRLTARIASSLPGIT